MNRREWLFLDFLNNWNTWYHKVYNEYRNNKYISDIVDDIIDSYIYVKTRFIEDFNIFW